MILSRELLWANNSCRHKLIACTVLPVLSNKGYLCIYIGFSDFSKGHPFMMSTKNQVFYPLPSVHMRPHEPDPRVDEHMRSTWIHITLLKRLVQWPFRPKAEIWLHDCNLFNTVLLVIYIINWCDLYRRKTFTFYSIRRRNSGKKDANFSAWEEYRMTSVDSNFNFLCGRPHGAWLPYPVNMRPPEPDPPFPSVWTS